MPEQAADVPATAEPPSILKLIEPVGVAVLPVEVFVTVAVNVTDVPKIDGLFDEVTPVEVVALVTVRAAVLLVVPVPPLVELISPVVLSYVPEPTLNEVTLMLTVQFEPWVMVPAEKLTLPAPALGVNVPAGQVVPAPVGEATTMFAGKVSVKATPVRSAVGFVLVRVKVRVVGAPTAMLVGENALLIVGGDR